MPEWIHNRAEHILAKNPSMPKSEAFAIATQQGHAVGKSPKGYGTAEGRHVAKAKYDTPKDDKKTANPGHLESPKMASSIFLRSQMLPLKKWEQEAIQAGRKREQKKHAQLEGGLADREGKSLSDFPPKKLDEGEKIELEHTRNHHIARLIGLDHLTEDPNYYAKLKKVEKTAALVIDLDGKKKLRLSNDHKIGARVPKGGSCCANCHFGQTQEDGPHCKNAFWVEAAVELDGGGGSSKLPAPADEWCCDEWKNMNEKKASAPDFFKDFTATGVRTKEKDAGFLSETWKAMNTPLPNTPKLLAGRNLGSLAGQATEAAKSVRPKSLEELKAARLASRRASYRPKTAGLLAFGDELEKLCQQDLSREREEQEEGGDEGKKHAFTVSQYSGPLGPVMFKQESQLPPFKKPRLDQAFKTAAPLTPAGRLAHARGVGLPKVTLPSGPSIGDIAKPHGFGTKIPGAAKSL